MARRIVLTSESLVRLTCHVTAYRFRLENERHARMAIEIKGLKLQAMTARGHLDRMTKAYAKFNEAAPAHAADVEGMAEQVTEMQSDLEFATNLLGNLPAVSGNGAAEKPKEVPKSFAGDLRGPDEQKLAVAPPLVRLGPNPSAHQEAGETPATTFQG